MNRSIFRSLPATAFALLLTACSAPFQSTTISANQSIVAQGKIFGGQQPIAGAAIQLFEVNTTTNGGASTPLITTTTVTTSDGSGNTTNANANAGNNYNNLPTGFFTITGDYHCPSSDTLVYLAYSGGNPGAGTNLVQEGLTALGACGNLSPSSYIVINELTTVGSVAALHNYMTAWNAVGSTPANASALTTAFNTAAEYMDSSTGTAPGPQLPSGADASSNDVRALANVVQTCVNSNGSIASGAPCYNFFQAAKGSAGSTPTNTVGALLDIAADPTNNVSTIFDIQSSVPAFEPTNTTAPLDWSLPILSAPSISPNGGTFTSATSVTLADTDGTAVMYYTTNGNTPTSGSTKYIGSFSLSSSATVKAIAVAASGLTSPITSATFTVNIPVLTAPTVSLTPAVTTAGSPGGLTLLATSNANGSTVTFGTAGSIGGTFNPATCVIATGSCATRYLPTGSLSAATYSNDLTAAFTATGSYNTGSASSTLTVNAGSATPTAVNLFNFTNTAGSGSYTGRALYYGSLIQAKDGLLYGTTERGGNTTASSFGGGLVFSFSPATSAYNVVFSFLGGSGDGLNPYDGVIQGPLDGMLYGTTFEGNSANLGVIFKVGTATGTSSDTILHNFTGTTTDGSEPYSGLIPVVISPTNVAFYGNVYSGGTNGNGAIYSLTSSGTYNQLYSLNSTATPSTGGYPRGSLVQHPTDGFLYGAAYNGGSGSGGTIFKIDVNGNNYQVLHNFYTVTTDGKSPVAGLIVGPDGYLYGTTALGGTNSNGTVFKIDYQGNNYSVIYSFAASSTDGSKPEDALYLASDGLLYGTTSIGGTNNLGTIFRMNTSGGAYTVLYSFGPLPNGTTPYSGLMQASDGNFYGGTSAGGGATTTVSYGTLFKVPYGPAPIQLAAPATVTHGSSFSLAYSVANAYSTTLQNCFATNNAGDTTGWAGLKTGLPSPQTVTLTAPSSGTYTYTLTCGGAESGFTTLVVQ